MNQSNTKPIVAALLLLLSVVLLLDFLSDDEVLEPDIESLVLPVTVVEAIPLPATVQLQVTGITSPRWPVAIQALVAGRVEYLDLGLEPGALLEADQLLLGLDPVHLLAEAELARGRVASAELALARQRHEQTVALQQLSKRKSTAFARHELQIAAAKAELAAAQQALRSANQRVQDAQVKAPFSAVLLERSVAPGQQLQAGDRMFRLAASDSLDVVVPLSEQLWRRLGSRAPQAPIEVRDRQGNVWPASVRYLAPSFDALTRQRQLVLAVANPYAISKVGGHRLQPDQQVSVQLTLPEQNNVVRMPLSVLTRDGQVWTMTAQNTLRLEDVTLVQQRSTEVWLQFLQREDLPRRVVAYPLLTMLEGQAVTSRTESALIDEVYLH